MTDELKRWQPVECANCGLSITPFRAQDEPPPGPHVCEGCEMYERGYQEGLAAGCHATYQVGDQVTANSQAPTWAQGHAWTVVGAQLGPSGFVLVVERVMEGRRVSIWLTPGEVVQ